MGAAGKPNSVSPCCDEDCGSSSLRDDGVLGTSCAATCAVLCLQEDKRVGFIFAHISRLQPKLLLCLGSDDAGARVGGLRAARSRGEGNACAVFLTAAPRCPVPRQGPPHLKG